MHAAPRPPSFARPKAGKSKAANTAITARPTSNSTSLNAFSTCAGHAVCPILRLLEPPEGVINRPAALFLRQLLERGQHLLKPSGHGCLDKSRLFLFRHLVHPAPGQPFHPCPLALLHGERVEHV